MDEYVESALPEVDPDYTEILSHFESDLGRNLQGRFFTAESDRLELEQEWIKDLRQFKGVYDPDVLAKMHPKRSNANLPITRTKIKAMTSRMCDILFPSGGEQHYTVKPSPVPELDQQLLKNIGDQITQITGNPPSEADIKNIVFTEAVTRAKAMEKEISDQLNDLKYREIIRQVVHSGNLYGTGILKGPMIKRKSSSRWVSQGDDWKTISIDHVKPFCEFVSIWDIYPDMSVTNLDNADYIFQRHIMPKHKVASLVHLPGFNTKADVITAYLKVHPEGNRRVKNHEMELSDLSQDRKGPAQSTRQSYKYEIIEFWGYLDSVELAEVGVEIDTNKYGHIVAANVWVLDGYIIKAVLSPIEFVTLPYYFYYCEKDETSIFGEGIARIMRDPAKLFNSAARAILDNAAMSAGPYIEANMDLLAGDEDPTDIYPMRVFQRTGTGADATAKAINVYDIPSHTTEFLAMANFFMQVADEITTIPRHMYGETSNMGSAARSPSSLSMLMGAANITVKTQIKNFDDGVTKPFVSAMYYWNMDFNPKQELKGDFEITAEGSSSLVTKEVMMEKMQQWLQLTNNPVDDQYTNRDAGLRKTAEIMEIDSFGLVKTADQITSQREEASRARQEQENKMFELEKLRAISSGHVNDAGKSKGGSRQETYTSLQEGDLEIPHG